MKPKYDRYKGHKIEIRKTEDKGHKIEIRKTEDKEKLFIDNTRVKYGQLPKGLYFLEEYAYDWKDNLVELSKAFIDYQEKAKQIHRERKSIKRGM